MSAALSECSLRSAKCDKFSNNKTDNRKRDHSWALVKQRCLDIRKRAFISERYMNEIDCQGDYVNATSVHKTREIQRVLHSLGDNLHLQYVAN